MIEEDFYATIKLKTGEEIFAKVVPTEEKDNILLLVNNPVIVSEFKSRSGVEGYKLEPWLKTTTEDLFVLNIDDVLTMTETNDMKMIMMHQTYVTKISNLNPQKTNQKQVSRKMGYISNINDAKKLLENIYKNS